MTRAPWRGAVPFEGVRIKGTWIAGNIDLENAKLIRAIEVVGSRIEGAIKLIHAHTDSVIVLDGSLVNGDFNAEGLHSESALSLATGVAFKRDVSLNGAKIDGFVNMSGASFDGNLDADGLQVGGMLLMQSEGGNKASFKEVVNRGLAWWDNWARRDPDYSPAPYTQLAAALTNAGDRDAANEIRYLGRVRERETEKGWSYIWSGLLQYVAGFGIGSYTFRVLYWVIGISLLGALYLRTRVKGARESGHGFFWCFGASLHRLLPVIEINKEFSEFFNDPKRERLTGWQSSIFSMIGILGFVLGAVLVAAVSGLTQNP